MSELPSPMMQVDGLHEVGGFGRFAAVEVVDEDEDLALRRVRVGADGAREVLSKGIEEGGFAFVIGLVDVLLDLGAEEALAEAFGELPEEGEDDKAGCRPMWIGPASSGCHEHRPFGRCWCCLLSGGERGSRGWFASESGCRWFGTDQSLAAPVDDAGSALGTGLDTSPKDEARTHEDEEPGEGEGGELEPSERLLMRLK